jgi:hypothetical protein
MMKTTSIKLSKALEGILEGKVESFLIWELDMHANASLILRDHQSWMTTEAPAYTACELMEVLPWVINEVGLLNYIKRSDKYFVKYSIIGRTHKLITHEVLAEALGNLLVWLHGEGLL